MTFKEFLSQSLGFGAGKRSTSVCFFNAFLFCIALVIHLNMDPIQWFLVVITSILIGMNLGMAGEQCQQKEGKL